MPRLDQIDEINKDVGNTQIACLGSHCSGRRRHAASDLQVCAARGARRNWGSELSSATSGEPRRLRGNPGKLTVFASIPQPDNIVWWQFAETLI